MEGSLSGQPSETMTGVMETKQRDRRRSLDMSASTVTLLEVDQNVSKVFAMAQERPISVYRYRTPYAVVVSTSMWLAASKIEDFVPPHSPLTRIKEVAEDLVKNSNIIKASGWVGTLDPYQVPPYNTYPDLVAEGGLPRVLVGGEGVPRLCLSCLRDPEIGPIDGHQAVVAHVI
mgnify:CR=1 FL=1